MEYILSLASKTKDSCDNISVASTNTKNEFLRTLIDLIDQNKQKIISINKKDIDNAIDKNLDEAFIDRLTITEKTIQSMIFGLKKIIDLSDPIGEISELKFLPSGIQVGKMKVPIGVVGMIYESRPNVTIDAAALCIKAGNACILRGGSEAINSNLFLVDLIHQALLKNRLKKEIVGFVEKTDRDIVIEMLKLDGYIDVIIPRGGKSLVETITKNATIPVIKHLDGICHIYIDKNASLDMAHDVVINAKTSRYGTCNTLETLLVHNDIAKDILPKIEDTLRNKNVEIRGCKHSIPYLHGDIKLATELDWHSEYLAPILSIKIVFSLEEAINHINHYGSKHTDSIITNDYFASWKFLRLVDSSSVMVNASTRFADGFEYGLGAEIGISTNKLHARGPVALDGLTTMKWIVIGSGQVRL